MVWRKNRRSKGKGKARRATKAKAVKEVAPAEDEAQVPPQPQQVKMDDASWQIQKQTREIEPIFLINEGTGQPYLELAVANVDGEWFPLKKILKHNQTEQKKVQINEERNSVAETCNHGCHLPGESTCQEFVETFDAAFVACRDAGERDYFSLFKAGVDATFIKYADVWKDTDTETIEWTRSFYLSRGARAVLDVGSDNRHACTFASVACFFAQYTQKNTEKAVFDWPLIDDDLLNCDDFSLVRFFKTSIPCSCLDEKYEEAKSGLFLDEAVADIIRNSPAIQQGTKTNELTMREMELVDTAFETDQLFLHVLPNPFMLQKRIHSPKTIRIECPKRVHSVSLSEPFRLSPLEEEKMRTFYNKFTCEYNTAGGVLNYNIRVAYLATREEFADMWNSSFIIANMSAIFLILGTQYLLEGNNMAASHYASLAYCFEQHIACNLRKERLLMNWPKLNELYFNPDEHTLVSFFKKRITCSCLDAKYKEVRSVKKLGICYSISCPHPDRKVDRSLTKCCSVCRRVNYCSRECQVDSWDVHKLYCHKDVEKDVAAVDLC